MLERALSGELENVQIDEKSSALDTSGSFSAILRTVLSLSAQSFEISNDGKTSLKPARLP